MQDNRVEFQKGRVNFAEEILAVFRMKKIDDITKYIMIINKSKSELNKKIYDN